MPSGHEVLLAAPKPLASKQANRQRQPEIPRDRQRQTVIDRHRQRPADRQTNRQTGRQTPREREVAILAQAVSGSSPEPRERGRGATRCVRGPERACASPQSFTSTCLWNYATSPSTLRPASSVRSHLYGTGAWGRAGDILNCYLTHSATLQEGPVT